MGFAAARTEGLQECDSSV
jgi:hypothetical protein